MSLKKRPRNLVEESSDFDAEDIDAILTLKTRGKRAAPHFEKALLEFIRLQEDDNMKLDDTKIAAFELALLLSQLGRHDEADVYLYNLGYNYKLAPGILDAPLWFGSKCKSSSGKAVCFDSALSGDLYNSLLYAFSDPRSTFWRYHGYPTDNFFSYNTPLVNNRGSGANLITSVANYLLPTIDNAFPALNLRRDAHSVEWWCHRRDDTPSGGAHQMHFDLDEAKLRKYGFAKDIHPIVSVVLYLTADSDSAPTLVTDQTLLDEDGADGSDGDSEGGEPTGKVATQGWLCEPKTNRLLAFDGRLLHGVVPVLDSTGGKNTHNASTAGAADSMLRRDRLRPRTTLMLGFWRKGVHKTNSPEVIPGNTQSLARGGRLVGSFGPNMRMSSIPGAKLHNQFEGQRTAANSANWMERLRYIEGDMERNERNVIMRHVEGPIWAPVSAEADNRTPLGRIVVKARNEFAQKTGAKMVEYDGTEKPVEELSLEEIRELNENGGKCVNGRFEANTGRDSDSVASDSASNSGVEFFGRFFLKELSDIRYEVLHA